MGVPATETCYRHPERPTGVRCQRCERPVCPDCMVPAPVGVQCPECVRASRVAVRGGRNDAYVTYGLIAINGAVAVAGLVFGGQLARWGGLFGPAVAAGQWWRIVTAAFLHSGLIHLAFNMAALFVFGPPLEGSLGRLRFLAIYVTSLLAGSLGALLLSPNALTVGASGAIFGLFGAILAAQRAAGINLRGGGMLPLLAINLVFTFAIPGISIGGHLGGLAAGFLAGSLLFDRRLIRRTPLSLAFCLGLAGLLFYACLVVA